MRLLSGTFFDQGANPLNHIARSLAVAVNACYCLPRLIQVWNGSREPTRTSVGVGYDGGERLVDLVSNRGRQLSHSHDPGHMGQLCLRLAQGLFGPLALGHLHDRTNKLKEVAGLPDDGMAKTLQMLCRSVRKNDSIVHFKITSFAHRSINRLLHQKPILRMNLFKEHGIRWLGRLGIESKDVKMFLRPKELSRGNIPTPTTGVAYSLSLCQVSFTAA